jgi:hypothetical protein
MAPLHDLCHTVAIEYNRKYFRYERSNTALYNVDFRGKTNTTSSGVLNERQIFYYRQEFYKFSQASFNPGSNLLLETKICLVISPPADLRATLVLVNTDIG